MARARIPRAARLRGREGLEVGDDVVGAFMLGTPDDRMSVGSPRTERYSTAEGGFATGVVSARGVGERAVGQGMVGSRRFLDALVVGAPGSDALLDGFGIEVFGQGTVDEGRKLDVGGEAEGDELAGGEFGGVGGGDEVGDAEMLFKADDAVLAGERVGAQSHGDEEEDECGEDPGEVEVVHLGPEVDGGPDGGEEIDEQKRGEDEVVEGIPGGVALGGLIGGHGRMLHGLR
jgi:hypothetical protein